MLRLGTRSVARLFLDSEFEDSLSVPVLEQGTGHHVGHSPTYLRTLLQEEEKIREPVSKQNRTGDIELSGKLTGWLTSFRWLI
jgi:hypothetical protein